jgi:hypothetical protein
MNRSSEPNFFGPLGVVSIPDESNFRELLGTVRLTQSSLCRQITNEPGSGFPAEYFSPLGVASIAVEANFRELLENDQIYTKHVTELPIESGDRTFERNCLPASSRLYSSRIEFSRITLKR